MFSTIALNKLDGGWVLPNGGYIYIEPDVIESIHSFRQLQSCEREAGGFLVGYFSGLHLHVTKLTTPYPGDFRGRMKFVRKDKLHIKQVTDWYHGSSGHLNVLGEWHTHPEPDPTPSSVDVSSWIKICKQRKSLPTFFLICGTEDSRCWKVCDLN